MSRLTAEQGRKAAMHMKRRAEENRRNVSRGHVDAAIAEHGTGKPLVTESLTQRLERLVPGASAGRNLAGSGLWVVARAGAVLATGHTLREAVDKAVSLYGVHR